MSKKLIDDIVWWIPFKSLRNKTRSNLYKKYGFEDVCNQHNDTLNTKVDDLYRYVATISRDISNMNSIYAVDIHLTEHCNLGCYSCSHFSQLADKAFYDLNQFEKDIKRLYELTNGVLGIIVLTGGEPLLNKDICKYINISRNYFKNSVIVICTNGILLSKQSDDFWKLCGEKDVNIEVTPYPINIGIEKIIEKCKCYNVNLVSNVIVEGEEEKTSFRLELNDRRKNHPIDSFQNCWFSKRALTLDNGKLYPCARINSIKHFNKYYNKNLIVTEGDYIDINEAKSVKEIMDKLYNPVPFCSYCNTKNWTIVGKWRNSKKDINEYLETDITRLNSRENRK